jgi:hypothetical protein
VESFLGITVRPRIFGVGAAARRTQAQAALSE